MATRVLLVDDEPRYRDYLSAVFNDRGFETVAVSDGRDAIDLGVQFRPDVLVTDWMLKNHIHGIHVSNVLQSIDPSLQTILITGFPSTDLKAEARTSRVLRFLEKPFEIEEIVGALEDAAAARNSVPSGVPFGVVEVGSEGELMHINDTAWRMFADTDAGRNAKRVDDLIERDAIEPMLDSPDWVRVEPLAPKRIQWLARSRSLGERRLLLLLPEANAALRHDPRIQILLEEKIPTVVSWPFADRVLILDDELLIRTLYAQQLERVGGVAYRAENLDLAVRLLKADSEIGVAILDNEMPGIELEEIVRTLERIRPGIKLVGNGAGDLRARFSAVGVERTLSKPWRVTELIDVLRD